MGRILGQRQFQITPEITAHCQSENTSYGFRHLCTLFKNGQQVGYAKASYYNRTWESFEYQSVLSSAIDNSSLSKKEKQYAHGWIKGDRTDWTTFNQTYGLAMMGDIMGSDQKQKNVLKAKALQTGLGGMGLDFPSDWGTLPEATKTKRLDAVMGILRTKGKPKKNNVTKQANALNKKIKEMTKI
jgi:hypothetical protein